MTTFESFGSSYENDIAVMLNPSRKSRFM